MATVQNWMVSSHPFIRSTNYAGAGDGSVPFVLSLAGIKDGKMSARHRVCAASLFFGAPLWEGRVRRRKASALRQSRGFLPFQVYNTFGTTIGVRWWQKSSAPNMHDINSAQELLDAFANAGEKLVVVEFFGTWCGTCRALYPKLCQIAEANPDIVFLKVNFESNTKLCRSLDVTVLPLFHFYRGDGVRLDSFSCSLSKVQRLKNAISKHNTGCCTNGTTSGLGEEILRSSLEAIVPVASTA